MWTLFLEYMVRRQFAARHARFISSYHKKNGMGWARRRLNYDRVFRVYMESPQIAQFSLSKNLSEN